MRFVCILWITFLATGCSSTAKRGDLFYCVGACWMFMAEDHQRELLVDFKKEDG